MPEKKDPTELDDDFERAWKHFAEKTPGEPGQAGGDVQAPARLAIRPERRAESGMRIKTRSPIMDILYEPGPKAQPDVIEDKKTTLKEPDGTSIEFETDEDAEANEIILEEIATFNFTKIKIIQRSALAGDYLRKMLPVFCAKENLVWSNDGDTFVITKKAGVEYTGKTMCEDSRSFITRLIGFFSKKTEIE